MNTLTRLVRENEAREVARQRLARYRLEVIASVTCARVWAGYQTNCNDGGLQGHNRCQPCRAAKKLEAL